MDRCLLYPFFIFFFDKNSLYFALPLFFVYLPFLSILEKAIRLNHKKASTALLLNLLALRIHIYIYIRGIYFFRFLYPKLLVRDEYLSYLYSSQHIF